MCNISPRSKLPLCTFALGLDLLVASAFSSSMSYTELISTIPDLFDVSDSIKVVEVAKKYDQPSVSGVSFCCLPMLSQMGSAKLEGTRVYSARRVYAVSLQRR